MNGASGVWVSHDRDLERQAVRRPLAHPLALVGVARGHVDAGQALVELVRGGISRTTKRNWSVMRAARASAVRPKAMRSGVAA